ncbi:purine permease 3-like [Papaver somniferum]|uniref:purine permease 3-like n=1 Tax=Papaver somniferum TaxID=3469 RepID=UPI000E6FDF96|nr:purine permease 3-like [Papaver somniferum]
MHKVQLFIWKCFENVLPSKCKLAQYNDTWIGLVGINSHGDRPVGVSKTHYFIGFLMTLASAALSGLIMPMIELAFSKATRSITYSTLLQFQITLAISANSLNIIGVLINKDFQTIMLFFTAFTFQLMTMGFLGVILYTSALFNGIFTSVPIPFTQVAAVIFYHEQFTGLKGMALALCLRGFCSYFYGEYKMLHKVVSKETPENL